MFFNGYFGLQDSVIAVTLAAMVVSTVRKQPTDSTYWIPFTMLSVLRLLSGAAVMLVSLLLPLRQDNELYYAVSTAGMVLTLTGAFFFFGAKAPASQIIRTGGEEGPELSPSGLYRFCRHPLFFGFILISAGVVADFASPAGTVVYAAVFVPVMLISARDMDRYWASRTGHGYTQYAEQVNRLLPSRRRSWKRAGDRVV